MDMVVCVSVSRILNDYVYLDIRFDHRMLYV